MLSLYETLRLNNEGAALYNANEPTRAAEKLHTSLLGARSLIQHRYATAHQAVRCYPNTSSPLEYCGKDRNGFFLYLRAMIFKEPVSTEKSMIAPSPVYFAGILFNLAILHHQHWTRVGSSVVLNKATVFYQAVLEILQGAGDLRNDSTAVLLAFVANNNLAQIELEMGDVHSFNQRLQYIHQFFYSSHTDFRNTLSESEIKGLLSNVLAAGSVNTAPVA